MGISNLPSHSGCLLAIGPLGHRRRLECENAENYIVDMAI